jgi:hypothetical protein
MKNAAPQKRAAFSLRKAVRSVLVGLLVFALLVCDTAACLAGGLARGLALAAAALLCALAKAAGLDGLNVTHDTFLLVLY